MVMKYKKIRKHRHYLHFARGTRRLFSKLFGRRSIIGRCLHPVVWLLSFLNPFRYIRRIDRYIISKFIGTYIYSIILIISISIVFDVNENLAKFTTNHAPLRAIILDYYANFIPYFANLFSPLFVFIAVIFFTSKLAGNSEVIAMLASGMSFKRLMRPYMISAAMISILNFTLGAYVIPKGTVVRHEFESLYKNNKKNTSASNVQLQVGRGIIAYIQQISFQLIALEERLKRCIHSIGQAFREREIGAERWHFLRNEQSSIRSKALEYRIRCGEPAAICGSS